MKKELVGLMALAAMSESIMPPRPERQGNMIHTEMTPKLKRRRAKNKAAKKARRLNRKKK